MATLGQPIPQSSDAVAFEGGYDVANNRTATKQIVNSQQANNTTYGPQLMVTAAINGYIAASSPPLATTALTDTMYTFSSQVNHVFIQNNYTASIQFELDATSTAGSIVLAAGQTFEMAVMATVVHLWTPVNININGSSVPNIVIRGWQ